MAKQASSISTDMPATDKPLREVVFVNPAGAAARCSMSEAWIYEQIKLYRETNGQRGLGPIFSPARKTLIRVRDVDRFIESFKERYA